MRAVDTNVVVRLIIRDDSKQVISAESFIEQGAWVSLIALVEAVWVLASVYEMNSSDQCRALEMLLDHKNLVLQDLEAVASSLELFRASPALRFSDCLMIELARKSGHLPLGTFDRNLAKIEGAKKL
jgi:predicted nucleic-acid-binding protein